jgi:hypothetical protein
VKGLVWRLEMYGSGDVKFRRLPGLLEQESAHRTLCFVFNLDPATFWFDLPSTAYGVGSASADQARGRRLVNGYVFRGPKGSSPVGTLTRVEEHEKIPDVNPHDRRDFFDLNHGR